ncbi:MAG: branched-chain-amino-acid transaminase [Omnitrophica bacterium GWA2_41_15]|nr:MAG: branched-chain-amino-acid transaminase [Omnitrophica bacterium GWA2_41_15]HAZ10233.1 branched-chain-amino-acid transaminase [Candidatus Omnitrophota bacterium]
MGLKVYINGEYFEKNEAKVSVFDHGLLYGDGVFEGIRSYARLIFKLKEHIDRLYESSHGIMLNIPLSKEDMIKAVVETLKLNQLDNAYIRLIVTRGIGDLGLDPRKCKSASIIIITDNIKLYPEKMYKEGLSIITVPTPRNIPEALNPQIKSLNYLNNILAKIEALNCGYEEALMFTAHGYVAECTGDNIFIIKDNNLITPPAYLGILKGITRACVMDIAKKIGMTVKEEVITRHNIFTASECFLTGTAAEIIPVVRVDKRIIGDGKPGKIILNLMKEFKKLTKTDGVKY